MHIIEKCTCICVPHSVRFFRLELFLFLSSGQSNSDEHVNERRRQWLYMRRWRYFSFQHLMCSETCRAQTAFHQIKRSFMPWIWERRWSLNQKHVNWGHLFRFLIKSAAFIHHPELRKNNRWITSRINQQKEHDVKNRCGLPLPKASYQLEGDGVESEVFRDE